MHLNKAYTTNGHDIIINIGGVFYHYDNVSNMVDTYTEAVNKLQPINTEMDIKLSDLTTTDSVAGSPLDQILLDPKTDVTKIKVEKMDILIKNYFIQEHPHIKILVSHKDKVIYIRIHNRKIVEYGATDALKNCTPINAPIFVRDRRQYIPLQCYSQLGGI